MLLLVGSLVLGQNQECIGGPVFFVDDLLVLRGIAAASVLLRRRHCLDVSIWSRADSCHALTLVCVYSCP